MLIGTAKSLAAISLFDGLSDPELASLASRCHWFSCSVHEQVINHLDTDDNVYFLSAGCAKVVIYSESGKTVGLRALEEGDVFGELSTIDGEPRSASVIAVKACTVAKFPAEDFRNLLRDNHVIAKNFHAHLVTQIRSLTSRVYEFSTLAVQNRVHAELLRLARASDLDGETICLSPSPRHVDIANQISTHREAVSRELSRLNKAGVIKKKNGSLYINDIVQLENMVHEATKE